VVEFYEIIFKKTLAQWLVARDAKSGGTQPIETISRIAMVMTEPYAKRECLHELFDKQAGHDPDAVAVIDGDQELSDRELNRRSNQLASHLRELGVGPDTLVANGEVRRIQWD
jgi:non-ribosomal peptide synthetase component F